MGVERFTVDDLGPLTRAWDDAVDRTPGADRFCAASDWSFSAATSFAHAGPPVVVGDGVGFCGMRALTTEDGTRLLVGLDPVWGFATPMVGHPLRAAQMVAARLSLDDHDLAVIAGQREDSASTGCLAQVLDGSATLYRGPVEHRLRADLRDGVDAWFARRSPRFRQQVRRLERRAEDRGLEWLDVSAMAPDPLFERLLAVEADSWKGREATGLANEDLAGFYRQLGARLARRDGLRVLIARLDGRDVGFIMGGVRHRTYRGLQLSYHRDLAELGIGHLLQLREIRSLVEEGIEVYDLGMDMAYKRRWADRVDETISVVVRR